MNSRQLNTNQSWDQLPDETDTAYKRFSVYLELGPDRTLEKTRSKLGKSSGYLRQLETWSSRYSWVMRANKLDRYLLQKSLKNKEEIMDRMTAKVLSRAEDLLDELLDIALHKGVVDLSINAEGDQTGQKAQIYSQKLKAIESALDRIGFVRQKEAPEKEPQSMNNYIQMVYNRIAEIQAED